MKKLIIIIFSFLLPIFCFAQNINPTLQDTFQNIATLSEVTETVPDIDFFGNDEPLKITLKYDITSFIKEKHKGEYLDAELTVNYKDIPPVVKNIRLKARGNFRRGQCIFPPIYMNFKTDPIKNAELEDIRKIKIVTHCSHSKNSTSYLLKEYLAYKLYNSLSDISFRVRLLDITYIDTGKKQKNYREFGFIIEPIELVAKRNESVIIDPAFVRGNNIIEESADVVALFEYMIGNTDWRFKTGHNMKYIKSLKEVTTKVTAVPYDFDFSGFVDAYYSFPQEWTSLKDVRSREYLGYCRERNNDYLYAINLFLNKKEEIMGTIQMFEYLDDKEKKVLEKYIDGFYTDLNRPERFISQLKAQCRTDF